MHAILPGRVRAQLSVMMFLQFFIWGAWFVTMGTYLGKTGFSGANIGYAYGAMWWGAIVAPFFIGMVADRFFAAEKVLGVLHLAGGVALYVASRFTEPGTFIAGIFLYALFYMPTLALVNAISFYQITDPAKQFPGIRVWGTIGWIAAGWIVGPLHIEDTAIPMTLAAGASVVFGVYCFWLPSTPPKARGQKVTIREVLNLDALVLMKNRSFAVLVTSSMLICIPLAFYYNFTNLFLNELGIENAAGKQTFGQMSELVFLLAMPLLLARVGFKITMLLGMLAWATRYALFALGASGPVVSMLMLGIVLHGICYDFFFVTGQIYVDKRAPGNIRASAQGLITLATYGVGLTVGSIVSGWVVDAYQKNWSQLWYVPAAMAAVITVIFALVFKDDTPRSPAGPDAASV